ncbi:MAG: ribosome recycling factor [Planctomycetota bacterium]|jgi:ribosome recycling factor|nr:ribosome recycling factor [Planctomycetota bacterium]MDP6370442.1 ribosome recycling factor [Planctomycetota bacterium]MDP6519357.1 ribosome recycling factor [Planctomycetota bacterium]MDP6838032.1 ribosome recycling factor [Planctomycetota bacterium]
MTYDSLLKDARGRMDKALGHVGDLLRTIRTSRASSALVDNIRVDYYGTPTPVSQLAGISIPEARQIVIKPFDASALGEVVKAIQKSDLGITPENDGKLVRLTIPPLSGEQRNKYVAKVKDLCEEGRIALRNTRRDLNKQADLLKKDGDITEDDNRKLHGEIQDLLKEFEGKVDSLQEEKSAEILEV